MLFFFFKRKKLNFICSTKPSVSEPLAPQASSPHKKVWHQSAHLSSELLGEEGLVVQSQFSLQNEFKTSLGYKVRVCFNQSIDRSLAKIDQITSYRGFGCFPCTPLTLGVSSTWAELSGSQYQCLLIPFVQYSHISWMCKF